LRLSLIYVLFDSRGTAVQAIYLYILLSSKPQIEPFKTELLYLKKNNPPIQFGLQYMLFFTIINTPNKLFSLVFTVL
jgi:hypothetical protein